MQMASLKIGRKETSLLLVLLAALVLGFVTTPLGAESQTVRDDRRLKDLLSLEAKADNVISAVPRDGRIWRLAVRASCLEVQLSDATVGIEPSSTVLRSCGPRGVVFEGSEFKAKDPSQVVLLPSVGHLRSSFEEQMHTVIYGIATCRCVVEALLSSGQSLTTTAESGTFFLEKPGYLGVVRLVAREGQARVLAEHVFPSSVASGRLDHE